MISDQVIFIFSCISLQGLTQLCQGQVIDLGTEMDINPGSVWSRPDGLNGSVSDAHAKMQQNFGSSVCFGQVRLRAGSYMGVAACWKLHEEVWLRAGSYMRSAGEHTGSSMRGVWRRSLPTFLSQFFGY